MPTARSCPRAPPSTRACAALPLAAPYAVSLAHRIRFVMVINAREAMHLIELRSQPQGHVAYREVAQQMHDRIREVGHTRSPT